VTCTRDPLRALPPGATLRAVDGRVRVLAWVDCTTDAEVHRAQEALSRVVTGLGLEGMRAHVVIDPHPDDDEEPHP
jgi:hypothetical protein